MTEKEFSDLYDLSKSNFERIAFSYTYDNEAAKDIVNDCFVWLWEHKEELTFENIKGYIYIAVRSRCVSWLRKKESLGKFKNEMQDNIRWKIETSLNSLTQNDMPEIFTSEIISLYRNTLVRMPELTRKVFLGSRNEELTYQQIALKYGVSVRKVTSEIQAALKLLRTSLKDYCGSLTGTK